MGYIDGMVEMAFKTTEDGTVIYYQRFRRKGYIVPNAEEKNRIRKALKDYMIVNFILLPFESMLMVSLLIRYFDHLFSLLLIYAFLFGIIFFAGQIMSQSLVKGLSPTSIKISRAESYQNFARSQNMVVLWLFEVIGIIILATGVFVTFFGWGVPFLFWSGICGIIAGGFICVQFIYMIKVKGREIRHRMAGVGRSNLRSKE